MSQNLEIEFKNMLSEEEYRKLLQLFNIKEEDIFTQENHYFDTSDFLLKQKGAALRIREKNGSWEMTLKQPFQEGLLETNQPLTYQEAALAINENIIPEGEIQKQIKKMDIPFSNIVYFGSLVTKRAEVKETDGLLVLDYSSYLNTEDFELEYEVENYQRGQVRFSEFLARHGIPKRETNNKIRRFYERKYSMTDSQGE